MSLGIFSIGSVLSKGLSRYLVKNGKYNKIILADIFPHFNYFKRFLSFKDLVLGKDEKIEIEVLKI